MTQFSHGCGGSGQCCCCCSCRCRDNLAAVGIVVVDAVVVVIVVVVDTAVSLFRTLRILANMLLADVHAALYCMRKVRFCFQVACNRG